MTLRIVRAAAMAGASLAFVSTAAAAAEIETVVVTGSYIKGAAEQTALPVKVITADDLKAQGSPSMTDLIKQLPSSSGVYGDANQFGAGRTEGSSSVNLRTLGQQRTLVLVNGRRIVISSAGTVPFVDLNNIPIAAIARLEVLKDGAAATYGSDAIGGVVNIITRTDLDGLELGGDFTAISGSSGDYTGRAAWGWNDSNVHVFLAAGYQHRSVLPATERDFVTPKFTTQAGAHAAYLYNPQGGWSSAANPGTYLNPAAGFASVADPACQTDWAGEDPLASSTPPNTAQCLFRYADFDHLVEEQNQWQGFGSVDVDLPAGMKLHVEGLYHRADITGVTQSVTYGPNQYPGAGGPTQPGTVLPYFFIPQSNPGLLATKAANPAAFAAVTAGLYAHPFFWRPMAAGGNPLFDFGGQEGTRVNNTYRVSADLQGDFGSFLGGVLQGTHWEVAATQSQSSAVQVTPDFLVDRLELALQGFGSLAGGPACDQTVVANRGNNGAGCYYFNPFSVGIASNAITGAVNPQYAAATANSAALVSWIYGPNPQKTESTNRQFVVDAVVSGELGFLKLPGGSIGWAAGLQYRKDNFIFDPIGYTDNTLFPCVDTPVAGTTNCTVRNGPYTFYGNYTPATLHQETRGIFAEINLPIFDSLTADFAIRHEELGVAGSTTNPKAQLRWQATDWVAFRGSVGTTFRAPPAAILIPAAVTALAFTPQTSNYRPYDTFGNPLLKPEKATNYNLGTIITADAFTATVDYWHFDFQNPLTTESGLNVINAIFPIGLPNHCADPAYTALLTRVTFTAGGCAAANIVRTRVNNINGAPVHTSGIDFAADYIWDDVWGGSLDTHLDGTYTIDYKVGAQVVEGVVTQPAFNAAGKLNYLLSVSSLPNWKGTLSFNYLNGPHSLQIAERYIGGMTDQRASIFASTNSNQGVVTRGVRIAPFITTDVYYRFNWADEGLSFNLAVVNLFDQDPPFARLDYSYDPFTSNPLGRTIKFGVTANL